MRRGRRAERGEACDMNNYERDPPRTESKKRARKNDIKKGE